MFRDQNATSNVPLTILFAHGDTPTAAGAEKVTFEISSPVGAPPRSPAWHESRRQAILRHCAVSVAAAGSYAIEYVVPLPLTDPKVPVLDE